MVGRRTYSIPVDLVARIDYLVVHGKLGYHSRANFINEAVRSHLKELYRLGCQTGSFTLPKFFGNKAHNTGRLKI